MGKNKKAAQDRPSDRKGLRVLFIHQNFPSPYMNIAAHLAANPHNEIAAIGEMANLRIREPAPNVARFGYATPSPAPAETDPLAVDFNNAVGRGQAAADVMRDLRNRGYLPDVICVNPDWGEGMFIRSVFPDTPILAYAEMYFHPHSPDLGFDPEFPADEATRRLAMARNAARALCLAEADHLQTPTRWQLDMLPPAFRDRSSLLHEGIDTDAARPNSWATLTIPPDDKTVVPGNDPLPDYVPRREKSLILDAKTEVFSFISRTLEPFMGWHTFARALPEIQKRRPEAHCVVVGRTSGGYGVSPPEGRNWRDVYLDEVREGLDFSRLHFPGNVPSRQILKLTAISRAHTYLTYPHVLSRSPLEAMSCGAPLVASRTGPVLEAVTDGQNALAVDFSSPAQVADAVVRLLEDEDLRKRLGKAGREHVVAEYDMKRVWLPRWEKIIRAVAAGESVTALR